ncbi:MAG: hypothetical protein EBZ48_11445 [Proteobacteria bacterium]|nr:hypothetical protein [Pseudomonadota bacterium]
MLKINSCSKIARAVMLGVGGVVLAVCSGCAPSRQVRIEREVIAATTTQKNPPGVVNYIWEEPMVDVVEVPPGLDPDGVYYRPSHQAVVEVRQGRWKYLRDK